MSYQNFLQYLTTSNPILQGRDNEAILASYINPPAPVARNIGALRNYTAEQLMNLEKGREKAAYKREQIFVRGLSDSNNYGSGNGNEVAIIAERLCNELKSEGFVTAYSNVGGVFKYKTINPETGKDMITSNWSMIRKQVGKNNPLYFSPAWRALNSNNKVGSAYNAIFNAKPATKARTNAQRQENYFKNAVRGPYLRARKLALRPDLYAKANSRFADFNNRITSRLEARRNYLSQINNLVG